jgi:V8-like Glu-specific endopeptidase
MRNPSWIALAVVVIALTVVAPAVAASASIAPANPQAETVVVTHPVAFAARKAAVQNLHQQLVERQVAAAEARALVVEIPSATAERIGAPAPAVGRLLVGAALPVGTAIDLRGARRLGERTSARDFGAVRGTRDGGFVWSGVVNAPGASAVRLRFSGFDLPEGAALYVYGADGQAAGPYTGRGPLGTGELHTNTIFGDTVRVQLRQEGRPARLPRGLVLESVGYMGPRFVKALIPAEGASPRLSTKAFCSYNETCVQNAACVTSSAVATARQAVASILFQSGASFFICTGGLLADTAGTQTPFFLTANHCIGSGSEASSVETYFDYVTTCSNPDCTQPYSNIGETVGATILSGASNTDHTLLQLSANPVTPDGTVAYLGWNSTAVANTNGFDLFRISHPSGAPQAYSEHSVDTGAPTCGGLPRGNFIYSRDTFGATEGGSSGSPVVDGDGNVVGQLFGACGFNVNDPCDAASNATVDGAFAAYFSSVAEFLDPDGGGGDPPSCSPKGASCTVDSDCCSNKCKGRSGAKTCK